MAVQVSSEVLAAGAARFGLETSALRSLGGMDGAVFAVQREGREVVIKYTPLPADKVATVVEKHRFIHYLAEHGVRVASPLRSRGGNLVEVVAGDSAHYCITLYDKAPGHHVNGRDPAQITPALFRLWGRTLGQMHALSQAYPTWRNDGGAEEPPTAIMGWPQEQRSFADWCQDDEVRAQWLALNEMLAQLPRERSCYGLIHNDLHPHNFLVDGDTLTVIDFDVAGYHWFATDLGIVLFHAQWGGPPDPHEERRAFFARFLEHLLGGYTAENPLGPAWRARLPLFVRYRQILLYIVFSDEWKQAPQPWQTQTLARWREQIVRGEPVVEVEF